MLRDYQLNQMRYEEMKAYAAQLQKGQQAKEAKQQQALTTRNLTTTQLKTKKAN